MMAELGGVERRVAAALAKRDEPKPKLIQTNVHLDPSDKIRLDALIEQTGWTKRDTIAAAIEALEQVVKGVASDADADRPSTEDLARRLIDADCLPGWIERPLNGEKQPG